MQKYPGISALKISMLRVTYQTPKEVLKTVKVGDEIKDEFYTNGIVKFLSAEKIGLRIVFDFHLENGGHILAIR